MSRDRGGAPPIDTLALVEAAVDGIVVIDGDGTVRVFNRACERLFGYDADEVIGGNIKMLMPSPYRDAHDGYLEQYRKTGIRAIIGGERQVPAMRKDGTVFPMELSVGSAEGPDGPLFVGIIRDISKRKALERAAQRHLDDIEALTFSIAHDLKAPLRAIGGFATALSEDCLPNLDAQGRKYLDHIVHGAAHMSEMIEALLQYSRVGRNDLPMVMLDPRQVIEDAALPFAPMLEKGEMQLSVDGEWHDIEAHRALLETLFLNLIDNAWKFVPSSVRPRVTIHGRTDGANMEITVSDNGVGIPAEAAERVFDIFQRLHKREDYPGTGIGLSIVKKVVDVHDGEIDVRESPDGGASFVIRLPFRHHGTASEPLDI